MAADTAQIARSSTRLRQLRALGVQPWYPRVTLALGKQAPPVPCSVVTAQATATPLAPPQQPEPVIPSNRPSAPSHLPQRPEPVLAHWQRQGDEVLADQRMAFTWVYRVIDHRLIVDQLDPSSGVDWAVHQRLCMNMLFALDQHKPTLVWEQRGQWPVLKHDAADSSAQHATLFLYQKCLQSVRSHAVQSIIFALQPGFCRLLMHRHRFDCPVVVIPPLSWLIRQPQYKAQAWQALQGLRE